MIQAKDDGGFEWDGSCGGGEKWSDSGCILNSQWDFPMEWMWRVGENSQGYCISLLDLL